MLCYIAIENFALIEFAEIEFGPHLTVITGETGAGKSILIDALGVIMGGKTDASIIRAGAQQCKLSAVFDITQLPEVQTWLREHDLLDETSETSTECTLTRIIQREGRQRQSINGQPVPQQTCREIAPLLLNILGQHQAQHLLRQQDCYAWLDCFARCQKEALAVRESYQQWHQVQQAIHTLKQNLAEKNARYDFLQFQTQELNQFELTEQHLAELNDAHRRLSQFEKIQAALTGIVTVLGDGERSNVVDNLHHIAQQLEEITVHDKQLQPIAELIQSALIPSQEALVQIRDYCQQFTFDSASFQAIDTEVSQIYQLARKHRVREEELPALKASLNAQLQELDHGDDKLLELEQQANTLALTYQQVAKQLTRVRDKAAKLLSQQVTQHIQQLGMPHAQFKVVCTPRDTAFHINGQESVQFEIMTNPGQPWSPLAKIASGGELSRIHLAMNVELKSQENFPTLICDEVDSGISGKTGHLVGKLLQTLGQHSQVITVTHLASIAALGQQHLQVTKDIAQGQTFSRIRLLDPANKIQEIARMLGGKDITDQTLALAKELVAVEP